MDDSDANWRLWGERDPYYAVLTDQRFRIGSIDQHRQAFFESGRDFVAHWLTYIERHFGALPRGRALDFGCGVGRMTIPLSEHFAAVVGVDIAPAMLEEARRNSADRAITYVPSDDHLSQVEGTFDFVNSCIVLQHIPVARGMALLAKLLDRVGPGGGCLIQLSTKRNRSWGYELRYRIRNASRVGRAVMNLLQGKAANAPTMQMNEYSLAAVLPLFHDHGFADMLVRFENHGGIDTAMIFARRS